MNPEVAATMNDVALKRDKFAAQTQNLTGSAMLALGLAITTLLEANGEEGIDKNQLLEYLCDAGKLFADSHHQEAMTRKSFILPGMEKNIKDVLEKSRPDKFIFGENLPEKIKSTKSIEKIASDLKPKTVFKKAPLKPANQLNWKSPHRRYQGQKGVGNKHSSNIKFSRNNMSRKPSAQKHSTSRGQDKTSHYKKEHQAKA